MKTIFTISNTTKSSLSDSTNQKKEKSICSSNAALGCGGLSICLVLEHLAF